MRRKKEYSENKLKKRIKRIFLIAIGIYVVYVFINQQIMLNYYKQQHQYYLQKIEEEKRKTEKLTRLKTLYETDTYIEKIARDKLGYVKEGERVFIDTSKSKHWSLHMFIWTFADFIFIDYL